jgi:tetratricopeptide (TPR) repeat protein
MSRPFPQAFLEKTALVFCVAVLVMALSGASLSQDTPGTSADVDTTNEAFALFEKGQDEHGKGNFAAAIELYDKALKILPEFAEAEFQRGNAYLSLGKRDYAEAAFRHAVVIRPEWTLALASLGTLLERRGEYTDSEKFLTKAISLDASSFPAYSGLIELRLKTNAPADELRPLLEKLNVFSSKANVTAAVFASKASLENALGDKAAAKKSIAKALEIEPNNKVALYQKAEIAISENDLVLGEEMTRQIDKIDAGTEDSLVLKARLFIAGGKNDDAKRVLDAIKTPSSETVKLKDQLALATEQSPEALEKALEKNPKDAFVLGKLCSAYRVTAPDKALDYCKRALDVEPNNINHAVGYGAALLQARRYDEAITILRRLVYVAPDNATIHANLATALFQSKRYAEAKTEYQWLTSHEPVPPIAYYFLAICHDQLEEFMDAGANYNLFLKYADVSRNQLEIDKVKLRLPILDRQIKQQGGKSKTKSGGQL